MLDEDEDDEARAMRHYCTTELAGVISHIKYVIDPNTIKAYGRLPIRPSSLHARQYPDAHVPWTFKQQTSRLQHTCTVLIAPRAITEFSNRVVG